MKKKALFLLFLVLPFICRSQEYVDLFSINYGKSKASAFEDRPKDTRITTFETNLTIPIVINDKFILITGIDHNTNSLQLFPHSNYNHLYSTRIKAGLKINHSEHWSGTYILLPKLASDYINISYEDFYFGGVAVLKHKKNKNFNYRVGLYASSEAYGLFTTPIISLYYIDSTSRFELNVTIPTDLDFNYRFTSKTKIGLEYVARGSSFKLTSYGSRSTYVENNSLEFSSYLQNNSINKNILLRLKLGFSTNKFEVYPIDQKIDVAVSAFRFGDDRTKLNNNLSISPIFKIEAIYRFDITSK